MKKITAFILIGALALIITDPILKYIQILIFNPNNHISIDEIWIGFLFILILFQWVFIIVLSIFYFVRTRLKNNNFIVMWALGALICFAFYSFYWLGADQGDLKTLRTVILNCLAFGYIMEKLYRRIILGEPFN